MPPTAPRFKNEISPNNRSKCHGCNRKIGKGEHRYGVVEFNDYGRTQRYYHPDCCPEKAKKKIPVSLQDSEALGKNQELVEQLRQLRRLFAEELEVEPFRIFHDKSLQELAVRRPQSKEELLKIWGIKHRKVKSFGSAILAVIRLSQREHKPKAKKEGGASRPAVVTPPSNKKRKRKTTQQKQNDNDDDDDIIGVGETLTCEQIVQRKFEQAKRDGHIISVDSDDDEDDNNVKPPPKKEQSNPTIVKMEYSEMKVPALKKLCRERNIDTQGMLEKSELTRALEYQSYENMSIKKLRDLCKQRNISLIGMLEKSDMVRALIRDR